MKGCKVHRKCRCACRNKPPKKGPLVYAIKKGACEICCCGRPARFSVPCDGFIVVRMKVCAAHLSALVRKFY